MAEKSRLSELDALRGLAALLVVGLHFTFRYDELYHHVEPIPFSVPLGKHGVELFFAISGFVIFMTLERTKRPMDFVVSRFSRLYPAYWAAMILTTAVVHLGGLYDQQISLRAFFVNLPMIQSALKVPLVDGAYWTLSVELCFYGCMFMLYLGRYLNRIEPLLVVWIALKWLWAAHFGTHQMSWALGVVLIQQYIPFFAIGMICYRLLTRTTSWAWVVGIIAFAIVTEFWLDGSELGVVACIVAGIFLLFATGHATWLRWRGLAGLGAISYTLYLLHENIGWTVIRNLESRGVGEIVAVPVALVTVLTLATLTTYLVEKPAMNWIRKVYRNRTTQFRPGVPQTS
jgi:peptidoglycan/LPS O-acetylase OafA/YrhL